MHRIKVALAAVLTCLMITSIGLVFPSRAAAQANEMGFIGCSMAENVAQGYRAVGGTRMWGPYGTDGLVVEAWTNPNSGAWQRFDQQASRFGRPTAVRVQICIFAQGRGNL